MRILLNLKCRLIFMCVIFAAAKSFGCNQLPAGQTLWIRLAAPVSTYTAKVGDPVRAVLTQDLVCDDETVLPMGSTIDGVVHSRRKVGWGIRHETAALDLEFHTVTIAPDVTVPLSARVEEVENAREQVRNGVILGIRSTNTFQGSISNRLIHLPTWNPYSNLFLITYKALFPIFPEPEIYYPAGTDIRLQTTSEISVPSPMPDESQDSAEAPRPDSGGLDQLIEQLPWRVTTTKNVDADLLNIIFIGSETQVASAFRESGWHNADPHTKTTWAKNFYALLNNSGYAQQPMTTFLLNGKPEDMDWQKGLNSYGRRDHLRIWRSTSTGTSNSVWVTSSTRDTSAVLAVRYKSFVHHIAPNIDEERSTVIRDLNFAGCVQSISYVSRPEVPTDTHNATGDVMHTDGSVAIVTLQDCRPINPQLDSNSNGGRFRPGGYVFRFIRKQILTYRNDILRANVIYGTYDLGRMTLMAFRHQPTITYAASEPAPFEAKQASFSRSPIPSIR